MGKKVFRLFQFIRMCLVKTKQGHSEILDWLPLGSCLLVAVSPLVTAYLLPEETSLKALKLWMSANGWYVSIVGLSSIAAVAFWHAFGQWDDLNERQRPRFDSKCDSADPWCKTTETLFGQDNAGRRGPIGEALYFRIIVLVTEPNFIKNCTAFVEEIRTGGQNVLHHKLQIPFVGDQTEDFAKTIFNGSPERLDILQIVFSGVSMRIRNPPASLDVRDLFLKPEDYLLKVVITGEGVPALPVWLRFTRTVEPESSILIKINPPS